MTIPPLNRPVWILLAAALGFLIAPAAGLTQETPMEEIAVDPEPEPDPSEYMRPTELGIRLTPQIAEAMTKRFVERMSERYDLDGQQAEAIQEIMTRRIMLFSHQNEETGQQMIEFMMATMIEYDGRFTPEAGKEFARMAKPLIPNLKQLFAKMGADIGNEMTLKQRLKFTGDMTAAAAGVTVFESRMKRWEEGKIAEGANPFWDPADDDPSKAERAPKDPNEHPDHRRARIDAERWIEWRLRVDEDGDSYGAQAIEYYQFDEKQVASAEAILKDCKDRAARIKTKEWRQEIKENRIARALIRRADERSRGPSIFALEAEFNRLQKPLLDLDEELKKRIDVLPDSKQRATARQTVRQMLVDRGMKEPPL